MIRILFLLLIVMSTAALAQPEKPQARTIDEFETATNGDVKRRMQQFYVELSNDPTAQGIIINYGTDREIARRERQIRDAIAFFKADAARITSVNGGFRENVKTEFWLVPAGADNPKPVSNARLFDEFGKFNDENLWARVDNLYVELGNNPNLQAYMIISGPTNQVTNSENRFKRQIALKKFDASRLVFKKDSQSKELKIQIWLVPAAEKNPTTKIYIVPTGAKPPTK